MSIGYVRSMSPATRSAILRKRAARRIKNLRVDEVSSVDRGAGHGVEILLAKRDYQWRDQPMTDIIEKAMRLPTRDLVEIAKTDQISKAQLSQIIDDKVTELHKAAELRNDGETWHQCYSRYITKSVEGVALFQIMKGAPGRDHHQEIAFKKHVNSNMAVDGSDADDGEDDDGNHDNFLGGPNANPFYECLRQMAIGAAQEKQHQGKSGDQIIDHLIRHDPVAGKLAAAASAHGLKNASA